MYVYVCKYTHVCVCRPIHYNICVDLYHVCKYIKYVDMAGH